nr:COX2 [Donax trunculus]
MAEEEPQQGWLQCVMVGSGDYFMGYSGVEFIVSYNSYMVANPAEGLWVCNSPVSYGTSVDYPLVVPGNCLVELLITSEDVIHSWTANGLGVKSDAIPGRINSIMLNNLRPGYVAWGGCSEMCGVNHWQMAVEVEVLSRQDFYQWAKCMSCFSIAS